MPRKLSWRRVVPWAVGAAALLALRLLPQTIEVCEIDRRSRQTHCGPRQIVAGVLLRFLDFGDRHEGAFLVLFTAALAGATIALWKATLRLAEGAEDIAAEGQRPWLSVDAQVASAWTWVENDEARITLRFTLRNVGRTPALNAWVEYAIYPSGGGFPDPAVEQRRISETTRQRTISPQTLGLTVFPSVGPSSAETFFGLGMAISASDIAKARARWKDVPGIEGLGDIEPLGITAWVVGCVDYRAVGGSKHHQTGFILELHRIDPDHPGSNLTIKRKDGDVPVSHLQLTPVFQRQPIID